MNINRNILTLEEFRKQELRSLPQATGELSNLLRDIALAAKRVNVGSKQSRPGGYTWRNGNKKYPGRTCKEAG